MARYFWLMPVRVCGTLKSGSWVTPLFLWLMMVEVVDQFLAVDSIPAMFDSLPDLFLVIASNSFAIMDLWSLYFCPAVMIAEVGSLKPAFIIILAFVGIKLPLLSLRSSLDKAGGWFGMRVETMAEIRIDAAPSVGRVLAKFVSAWLRGSFDRRATRKRIDRRVV